MAETTKIVLEVDSTGAVKSTQNLEDAIKSATAEQQKQNEVTSDGMAALDKMTNGAVTGFRSLVGGVKKVITGMTTLKGAIMATGIGALLVAVTSLVAYFRRTEEGAGKLRVIMAVLGSVFENFMDIVGKIGGGLISMFEDPKAALMSFWELLKKNVVNRFTGLLELIPNLGKAMKQLFSGEFAAASRTASDAILKVATGVDNVSGKLQGAIDGMREFGNEIANDARQAAALERAMNNVKKAERDILVERAKANKAIAEAKLIVQDTTKSAEERVAALKLANELELKVSAQELATQQKRLRVMEAQAELSDSNEETLDEIAAARARVLELETASIQKRTELAGQVKALEQQIAAEAKAAADEKQKQIEEEKKARLDALEAIREATSTDQENEIFATEKKYNDLIAQAVKFGEDTAALEEAKEAKLQAIRDKYAQQEADAKKKLEDEEKARRDKEIADQQALMNARFTMTQNGIAAIGALVQAATAGDEAQAERAFNIQKRLSMASAVVSTAQAVAAALTAGGNPIKLATGAQFVEAGIAAATGAAQIALIAKQKFEKGDASAAPSGIGTTGGRTGLGGSAPSFNVVGTSGINQIAASINGSNKNPVRAYVVSGDVTTAQSLDRKKELTSTFG